RKEVGGDHLPLGAVGQGPILDSHAATPLSIGPTTPINEVARDIDFTPTVGVKNDRRLECREMAHSGKERPHARSRILAHASTVTKVPTKSKKNEENHGVPRARQIAPQPRASIKRRLATSKVNL
ncbi:hypothetical protein THAOC_22538, partial [Thalassiosira oceanica]